MRQLPATIQQKFQSYCVTRKNENIMTIKNYSLKNKARQYATRSQGSSHMYHGTHKLPYVPPQKTWCICEEAPRHSPTLTFHPPKVSISGESPGSTHGFEELLCHYSSLTSMARSPERH